MTVARDVAEGAAAAYYEKLKGHHLAALWTIPGTDAAEPTLDEVPHVWRAKEIFPLLEEAIEVVELGQDADRRALNAANPRRVFGTSHNIVAGYQMVLPGETAPAHRHTPSAIRLLLQGSGITTVDGEPVYMERGDLVLTPPMTWHDHRHPGDVPMIWLDGLDVPFVRSQHAQFFEEYPAGLQILTRPQNASVDEYAAGLVPAHRDWNKNYSPLNNYRYTTSRAALARYHHTQGSPTSGSTMEYINPLTGGHIIPTLSSYLTLLPATGTSKQERHTPSKIYCVLEGTGHSIINGKQYNWEPNDFFVIPSWHWYQHHAHDTDTILYSLSDWPIYEPFGLLRHHVK